MSQDERASGTKSDSGTDEPRRNSVLEYLVAGAGLLLVGAAVGFMLWAAFTGGDAPPVVHLRVLDVTTTGSGYRVRIEARNTGDEAAAELGVEGTAVVRGVLETRGTTFDFLPPDSVREGGLFFSGDPRSSLTLRVLGYREP